ncbi:MAG: hypothetical protein ACOCU4_10420 [Alkalispirochaeta sp.]
MKTFFRVVLAMLWAVAYVPAQEAPVALETAEQFRDAVAFRTSLADVSAATNDMAQLQEMAERVLILDGVAASVTVYSVAEDDFYVEVELVSGSWNGLESMNVHSAYVVLDTPSFADQVAEREPRDPPADMILRNRRVLVAGRLVNVAESPSGELIPVIQAFEARVIR